MKDKKQFINLLFSAFLVTAFVICSYFFNSITTLSANTTGTAIKAIIFTVFGLLLFYATRVGDGKQVKRFSLVTLIVLDVPALYIILATLLPVLPFGASLSSSPEVMYIAGVALGYGIPYTFLSGYEMESPASDTSETSEETEDDEETEETPETPVPGGIKEELTETLFDREEASIEENSESNEDETENLSEETTENNEGETESPSEETEVSEENSENTQSE